MLHKLVRLKVCGNNLSLCIATSKEYGTLKLSNGVVRTESYSFVCEFKICRNVNYYVSHGPYLSDLKLPYLSVKFIV